MKRVAAKLVFRNCYIFRISQELLNDLNDNPDLLKLVITDNETLVYVSAVETQSQSSQWTLPEGQFSLWVFI